jgi:hypothetical protein
MKIWEKYPAPVGDAVFKRTESTGVLLNLDNGMYYTLNKSGTFLYILCDGKRSLTQIAGIMAEEYGLELEIARRDLKELIAELCKENLIQLHDTAS